MTRWIGLLLWLVALGCAPHRRPAPPATPEALEAALTPRVLPPALRARFTLRLRRSGQSVSTSGALILGPPAAARLDIYSPLGTPLYAVAGNGRTIDAVSLHDRVFYRGREAVAVLSQAIGGGLTMQDIVDVLAGTAPALAGATRRAPSVTEDGYAAADYTLAGGKDVRVEVDLRRQVLRHLHLTDSDGQTWFQVDVSDLMRQQGESWPKEMDVALPRHGIEVRLSFRSWDALGIVPDVFTLAKPPGWKEVDFLEVLE